MILQITKGGDNIDFINYVGAVFGLLVMFYIPTKAFNIVYEWPNLDSFEFRKRYKTLIAGLKTSDPLKYQFTWVFLFRRAIFAALLIVLASYPSVQVSFALVTWLGVMVYGVIVKPYWSRLSSILLIVNEWIFTTIVGIWMRFLRKKITPDYRRMIGTTLVYIIGTIIINWIGIIVFGN